MWASKMMRTSGGAATASKMVRAAERAAARPVVDAHIVQVRGFAGNPRKKKRTKAEKNMVRNRPVGEDGSARGRQRKREENQPVMNVLSGELRDFLKPENLKAAIQEAHEFGSLLVREPDFSALRDADAKTNRMLSAGRTQQLEAGFKPASLLGNGARDAALSAAVAAPDERANIVAQVAQSLATADVLEKYESPPPGGEIRAVAEAYERLIQANRDGDVQLAQELFKVVRPLLRSETRQENSVASTAAMLMREEGPFSAADFVQSNVFDKGLEPGANTVAVLLEGCINRKEIDRAERMWDSLRNRSGFRMTAYLASVRAKMFAIRRDGFAALQLLNEFENEVLNLVALNNLDLTRPSEFHEARFTRKLYHNVMFATAHQSRTAMKTFEVFRRFRATQLPPNSRTLAALLLACGTTGDAARAQHVWEAFRHEFPEVELNRQAYNGMLKAYAGRALAQSKRKPKLPVDPSPEIRAPRVDEARELIKLLTFLPKDTLFNPRWRKLLHEEAEEVFTREAEMRDAVVEAEYRMIIKAARKARGLPDSSFPDLDIDLNDLAYLDEGDAAEANEISHTPEYRGATMVSPQELGFGPDFLSKRQARPAPEIETGVEDIKLSLPAGADEALMNEILAAHKRRQAADPEAYEKAIGGLVAPRAPEAKTYSEKSIKDAETVMALVRKYGGDDDMDESEVEDLIRGFEEEEELLTLRPGRQQQTLNGLGAHFLEPQARLASAPQTTSQASPLWALDHLPEENPAQLDSAETRTQLALSHVPEPVLEPVPENKPALPFHDPFLETAFNLNDSDNVFTVEHKDMGSSAYSVLHVDIPEHLKTKDPLDELALFPGEDVRSDPVLRVVPVPGTQDDRIDKFRYGEVGDILPRGEFGLYEDPANLGFTEADQPVDVYASAQAFFDEMVSGAGIAPDASTLNALMSVSASGLRLRRAQELLREVFPKYGVAPDMESYVTIARMLARARRADEAKAFMDEVAGLYGGPENVHPDIIGGAMSALASQGRMEESFELLRLLKRLDMPLDERWVSVVRNEARSREIEPPELDLIPEDPYKWKKPEYARKKIDKMFASKRMRKTLDKITKMTNTAMIKLKR